MGNTRFAVLHESQMPADWETSASASYKTVVAAARECQRKGHATGPEGEVLITISDRFAAPLCYRGPWLETEKGEVSGIHPLLQLHVVVYGFHVIEEVNVALFALLEAQHKSYMGFIVTDGPVMNLHDQNYVPVLRAIDHATTTRLLERELPVEEELEAPRVMWTYVDGRASSVWRTRYNVDVKDLPAFLIVDPKRDRTFSLRKRVPRFEEIKNDVPWKVGGEQHQLLEQFIADVLADKYYGEKMSLVGRIAEHLSHYETLEHAYSLLGYDDFTFIVVLFAACFFMFLMLIGCVAEPIMEHYDERAKRQAEQEKKKMEEEKKKKE
ncbi:disulfide isomerase [Strigomonas culicis]|nr:disulfide isomerase [Strigomonas culicis]|eukprot:EPY27803.1 disulfide isomerase [Strigomonas culicis]